MENNFFQSRIFGEFQEKVPSRGKYWLLNEECLVVRQKLPSGFSWLWIPYGPPHFSEEIFKKLKQIAREEKAIFARIEPPESWNDEDTKQIKEKWRMREASHRYTPQHTLILNIFKKEEEILAQMKPKGRYNIRVAKKNGVKIESWRPGDEKSFSEFYEILKKTGGRDEFGIHPIYYYRSLLETFMPGDDVELLLARTKEGTIIAGIMVMYNDGVAMYYYGASDYAFRNLMAPYLLQWEAIKRAKHKGCEAYDFLGIAPDDDSVHAWAGVTRFKKQFGGEVISYPVAFEITYRPVWHWLYRMARSLR